MLTCPLYSFGSCRQYPPHQEKCLYLVIPLIAALTFWKYMSIVDLTPELYYNTRQLKLYFFSLTMPLGVLDWSIKYLIIPLVSFIHFGDCLKYCAVEGKKFICCLFVHCFTFRSWRFHSCKDVTTCRSATNFDLCMPHTAAAVSFLYRTIAYHVMGFCLDPRLPSLMAGS